MEDFADIKENGLRGAINSAKISDGDVNALAPPTSSALVEIGSSRADRLVGSDEADTLNGGAGDDTILGQDGDDLIRGAAGDDNLNGGAGADRIAGAAGADRIFGGDGDDDLSGGGDDDLITGNAGADIVNAGGGSDIVRGGGGADTLSGGGGRDALFGGGGQDAISGDRGADAISGNGGRDIVSGGRGADTVFGNRGADEISGDEGRDVLDGGRGADRISGGDGDDTVIGGDGDDELVGNLGSDEVRGEAGDDLLVWNNGDGSDLLNGGEGDDRVQVNFQNSTDLSNTDLQNDDEATIASDGVGGITFNRVAVNGQSVNGLFQLDIEESETFEVNFGGGEDTARIVGNSADNAALLLDAGDGFDTLDFSELEVEAGGEGVEINLETGEIASINGVESDDIAINFEAIAGTEANDTITGDGDTNIIEGGGGTDQLKGGDGLDVFVFRSAEQDSITDFEAGNGGDVFLLDREVFPTASADVNFATINATAVHGLGPVGNELGDANVVVVLSTDDDGDPTTAFNARSAAQQIAELTDVDDGGFFVYFNSGLGVNRVVFSENLNDGDADLQIIARLDNTVGDANNTAAAEEQLNSLVEDNFSLSFESLLLL